MSKNKNYFVSYTNNTLKIKLPMTLDSIYTYTETYYKRNYPKKPVPIISSGKSDNHALDTELTWKNPRQYQENIVHFIDTIFHANRYSNTFDSVRDQIDILMLHLTFNKILSELKNTNIIAPNKFPYCPHYAEQELVFKICKQSNLLKYCLEKTWLNIREDSRPKEIKRLHNKANDAANLVYNRLQRAKEMGNMICKTQIRRPANIPSIPSINDIRDNKTCIYDTFLAYARCEIATYLYYKIIKHTIKHYIYAGVKIH